MGVAASGRRESRVCERTSHREVWALIGEERTTEEHPLVDRSKRGKRGGKSRVNKAVARLARARLLAKFKNNK